jgi:hypothetical protein
MGANRNDPRMRQMAAEGMAQRRAALQMRDQESTQQQNASRPMGTPGPQTGPAPGLYGGNVGAPGFGAPAGGPGGGQDFQRMMAERNRARDLATRGARY